MKIYFKYFILLTSFCISFSSSFAQSNHWQIVQGDPLDKMDKSSEIVRNIRKRKGLKEEIPEINNFYDKL